MRRRGTVLGMLAAALLGGACDDRPGPATPAFAVLPPLLVTLTPAAAVPDDAAAGLPDGTRLVRVEPGRADLAPVDLGAGLSAAGRARVSHDAGWVLFSARERPGGPTSLWRCRPDGRERARAVGGQRAQSGGAWLADGRVVCAEALAECESGAPCRWALSVAPGDGTAAQRITFGVGDALDPDVLPDGRIVFATQRATPDGASFALWSVHTDGTGVDLYHRPESPAAVLRRPRVRPDGGLVVLVGAAGAALGARLVSARVPLGPSTALPGGAGALAAVEPLQGGGLLLVAPASQAAPGVLWLAPDGTRRPLELAGPGERVLDVAALEPRPRPQGHLSLVDASKGGGQMLVLDARPEGPGPAVRLRLLVGDRDDPGRAPRLLGAAPLASDGSVFVRVPADQPLWFEVLSADGAALARTHAPVWVRPNETRGCIGCHDDRDTVPPNRRPLAVHEPAVLLTTDGAAATAEAGR